MDDYSLTESFYGLATVGERGQVVIPAEARKKNDINPGDKIMFVQHPLKSSIIIFKADVLKEFLTFLSRDIEILESQASNVVESEEDK